MSNEQVELWQLEFYKAMKEISPVNFTFVGGIPIPEPRSGKSAGLVIGVAWKAFLAAKRSQPVIELPEILPMSFVANSKEYGRNMALREAAKAITDAGYQYKVRE